MKLNYGRTFFIGLAFMSISAFWQLYDALCPCFEAPLGSETPWQVGLWR